MEHQLRITSKNQQATLAKSKTTKTIIINQNRENPA